MPDAVEAKYEEKDFSVRWVVTFGIGLALMVIVSLTLVVWFFRIYGALQPRVPAASALATRGEPLPPPPRLQASPESDLSAMRAREDAVLYSYGWVDRRNGIVRIPITRAMDLLVEKGSRK
jgi:hypothetical protein